MTNNTSTPLSEPIDELKEELSNLKFHIVQDFAALLDILEEITPSNYVAANTFNRNLIKVVVKQHHITGNFQSAMHIAYQIADSLSNHLIDLQETKE